MLESQPARTLLIGVGNLLLSDEGVGVKVIERLAATYQIPQEVQILDGGTLGLDLLYYLEGIENLLLVDAVQAGKDPGNLIHLEGEAVPAFLSIKISPHQIGIPDMLAAARLTGVFPSQIALWGVQPGKLDVGLQLSEPVSASFDTLLLNVVAQLRSWGHDLVPL